MSKEFLKNNVHKLDKVTQELKHEAAGTNNDTLQDSAQEPDRDDFLDDPDVNYLEGLEDSDIDFLGASWDEPEGEEDVPAAETATMPIPPLSKEDTPVSEPSVSEAAPAGSLADASISDWFFTFMCINIPIAGWFYLFHLAFRSPKTDRRNFARAFLFYKLVFLAISAVILGILIWLGLDMLDEVLAYMEML